MNLKKIIVLFGILFLFLWSGYHLFFFFDRREEEKLVSKNENIERLSVQQRELLQEGDIILRRGYGFFSDIIAQRLNDSIFDVTHSGILYKKNNKWWVIHSLSSDASNFDGMQEQSLSEFLLYCIPNKLLVVRPKNLILQQGEEIVKRALFYLEKKVPFDHFGVIDEPSKMYCTELIWQILDTDLKLIKLPVNPLQRKDIFYSMKSTYDTTYFDIIVNTYKK